MVKGTRPRRAQDRPRDQVILDSEPDADPCSQTRDLEFEPSTAIDDGIEMHLVPSGDQVWLLAGSQWVGSIESAAIPEVWVCIRSGWAFNGQVRDVTRGRAVATVRGHRTK